MMIGSYIAICINLKVMVVRLSSISGAEVFNRSNFDGSCLCTGIGMEVHAVTLFLCPCSKTFSFSYVSDSYLMDSFCHCWIQMLRSIMKLSGIAMKRLLCIALRDI